jgi:BON domain-containing protein
MKKLLQEGSTSPPIVPQSTDLLSLASRINRHVDEQTGGGVRELTVEVELEVIRLRGRCVSFYCKQLAQHAAMRLSGDVAVVNEIEVIGDH